MNGGLPLPRAWKEYPALIEVPVSPEGVAGRLAELLDREGPWIVDEPTRLRTLLRAAAGEHDDEVDLLVVAAELGIARELIHERETGVLPGRLDELAARLATRREISESDARWAVDTWAWALAVEERRMVFATPAYIPPPRRPFRVQDHAFSLSFLAFVVATVAAIVVLTRGGSQPQAVTAKPVVPSPVAASSPLVLPPAPAAVGLTREAAVSSLREAGFEKQVRTRESRKADPGTVIAQRPAAGTALEPGATVTLVVAIVPEDVGRPQHLRLTKSTSSVTLTWQAPTRGSKVDHYEIWRDGVKIGERRAGRPTYSVGGLTPGSTYHFGIIAVGENGTRTTSRSRSVTLPVPAPPPVEEPTDTTSPTHNNNPPPPPPPPPDECSAPDPSFCD